MTVSSNARIRHLKVEIGRLAARHANTRGAAGRFVPEPAQLEALTEQPWWRDEYQEFAPSLALLSQLVIDNDGRRWGDLAHVEQWDDPLAVLNPKSTCRYHFLTRARGWSKTTDLAAIAVVIMLTQSHPGDRLDVVAADRDQGALLINAINKFMVRTPGLAGQLQVSRYKVTAPRDIVLEAPPPIPPAATDANPRSSSSTNSPSGPTRRRRMNAGSPTTPACTKSPTPASSC